MLSLIVMKPTRCRAGFTAEDFQFVVHTLARSRGDAVSLVDLLTDEETRDSVLDHDLLAAELIDHCGCLKVSPHFYFYVLTRRVLQRSGIEDRETADYVASVLVTFTKQAHPQLDPDETGGNSSQIYLSDILQRLGKPGQSDLYPLRAYLADYALFASGIFAERVRAHADRRGGPDLSFYEHVGQASYHVVAQHRMAKSLDLAGTFQGLADRFHEVRCALNFLAENLLHLSSPPQPILINPAS